MESCTARLWFHDTHPPSLTAWWEGMLLPPLPSSVATAGDGELHAWNVASWEPGPRGLGTLRLSFHGQLRGDPAGLWVRRYWPGDKGVGEPYRHEEFGCRDRGLALLGRDWRQHRQNHEGYGIWELEFHFS